MPTPEGRELILVSNMNVLVLGASGMLGHKVAELFCEAMPTTVTTQSGHLYERLPFAKKTRLLTGVCADDFESVIDVFATAQPDVVINCIGIVKQKPSAKSAISSITINALFPHRLANLCETAGSRLIQISTDCVFSGERGCYTEVDVPDPIDLYGRSKLLGEVQSEGVLTIRTSIIGRELNSAFGLLEWFLQQQDPSVKGYSNAIFSGFTTNVLSEILLDVVMRFPGLSGLYHVSSEAINKYDLLLKLKAAFGTDTRIEEQSSPKCDRSLKSDKFLTQTGSTPPSWDDMISRLVDDNPLYDSVRHALR